MTTLKKISGLILPAIRISFALILLTSCILLTAEILGFTPQENKFLIDSRTKISESLALQMSILIPDQDIKKITKLIRYIVKRNPDILSAGIRLSSKNLIFKSANHVELWGDYKKNSSTTSHVIVPMSLNGKLWGNIELRFKEIKGESIMTFFERSIFKLIAFVALIGFFAYLVFMLRTLRQLDPTAVIPERVNSAFNTLAEGVIIIDEKEQILLANKAFSDKIGRSEKSLLGIKTSELKWQHVSEEKSGTDLPWKKVLKTGKSTIGAQIIYKKAKNDLIKFAINASPILGEKNKTQGVLITLDDISILEQRNTELKTAVTRLHKTQFKVQQQNKELTYLATRDPMTGCLNRRSLNEQFKILFDQAKQFETELAFIMVDIDHFKLVNDNYGHATGDVVIKFLAEILKSSSRKDDLVARYGGEEFCVVLPGMSDDGAVSMAERIRLRIKKESAERFENGPRITISLGVSSMHDNPENQEILNNLADEALYVAKESGRNQVVRWKTNENTDQKSEASKPVDVDYSVQPGQVEHLQNRIEELEGIASSFSAQLEYQESYDELTGLPKQLLFYDRINQAIERGSRLNQLVAMLVIDIEMFSQVNTTLGRSVGDKLLQEFALRLNNIFRKSDGISRLTISRFTGDEFAILLTDISHQDKVTWAVKRLLDSTEQAIEIDGNTIHVSVQVGASLYPIDANSVDELFDHAMTAKKYCKNNKTQFNYQFYDQHMQEVSIKHLQLEKELHAAIKEEQWVLLYQPKMDIQKNKIIGAEALIRWQHPQRGLLTPYEFIDFAEKHNLIIPIGDWVIHQACQQLQYLMSQGITDCKIAVNLSSLQLVQTDVVQKLFDTLERFKIPPRLFEIEVTETALIDNIETAAESLKRINSRGIKISIDDFGTGYSSLNYLKNLPINCLKIDRSFIKDICDDYNDKEIVKTLITMAHSLDLSIIAEGVETEEQFNLLNDFGCDEIQGYLLSKPTSPENLIGIITNNNSIALSKDNK